MKKVKWWMRVIGIFYLILTIMNLYGLYFNLDFIKQNLPSGLGNDDLAVQRFADAWLVFVYDLGATAMALLVGSFDPIKSKYLIVFVLLAEFFRGIVCDLTWINRGYDPKSYYLFILIHIVIISTGLFMLKKLDDHSVKG